MLAIRELVRLKLLELGLDFTGIRRVEWHSNAWSKKGLVVAWGDFLVGPLVIELGEEKLK